MKNMNVGTRLAAGYALVLVLLAIIVGTGLLKMRQLQERIENITDVKNVQVAQLTAMRSSVNDRMIALRNIAMLTDRNAMRPEVERLRQQEARYTGLLAKLAASFEHAATTAEEKVLLATIQEQERLGMPLMAQAEKLGMANQAAEAAAALMHRVRPVQRTWVNALNELIALEETQTRKSAQDAKDAYGTAVALMLVLGAAALLAGVGAAAIVTRSLLRQLGGEPGTAAAIAAASPMATSPWTCP